MKSVHSEQRSSWAIALFARKKRLIALIVCLMLACIATVSTSRANDPGVGDYFMRFTNWDSILPDRMLFNANTYFPKNYAELAPYPMLQNTDRYLVEEQNASKELGVTPFLYYYGDFLGNPFGGTRQQSTWAQLLIFGAEVKLDSIGWTGGKFIFSFADFAGNDLSRSVGLSSAGNFFAPSQTVSLDTFANNSLFLQQDLNDGNIQLRIGRFQSASVFASLPAMGALPVNAAVNSTPTSLFLNVAGWHATSKATWAAYAKVKPSEDTYFKAAIFQVNPQVNNPNYHGFAMGINKTDGTLLLTELGWTPVFNKPVSSELPPSAPAVSDGGKTSGDGGKSVMAPVSPKPVAADTGLPGIYMVGAYLQNYPQVEFNGQTIYQVYGGYLQGQQMLWNNHSNPKQNFNVWGGVTYSPQTEIAIMPVMGYGGVYFQGLIPGRNDDVSFLNFYTGNVSGAYAEQNIYNGKQPTEESVVELSYIVQLTDHFQFQPDLQYIIQPGGWGSVASAMVIGFQVSAQF